MKKPTIVYVSGAPGSGKSTLAKLISEQLNIPYISSDMVQGGLEYTRLGNDRTTAITSIFVPMLVDTAQRGISFVVDHVLQKNIAHQTIITKLQPFATVVYIHVKTTDPISRYIERISKSELPDILRRKELLLSRAKHHTDNLVNTANPIDLGIPTIIVHTDDGYSPNLDKIMEFVNNHNAII